MKYSWYSPQKSKYPLYVYYGNIVNCFSNFRYLDANRIKRVPDNSFRTLKNLKQLRLDANQITKVPVVALNQARMLEAM